MYSPSTSLHSRSLVPAGLSICAGVAGLAAALGAGQSEFLRRLSLSGGLDFYWGGTVQVAAIVVFVGAILALMQHEAGGPLLAGAGTVIAVVAATTVISSRFELKDFLDEYPLRGLLFLGGGLAGLVAAVLGLICLRGRGKPALGIISAMLAIGVLACHAALYQLDDRQEASTVRPFLGIGVIVGVMVLGSFVGRSGALAATAGAACLFPLYVEFAEFPFGREKAAVVAAVGLAAIIAMSLVAVVMAHRDQPVQHFGQAPPGADWMSRPDATQPFAAQPGALVTGQQPAWDTAQNRTQNRTLGYGPAGDSTPGYVAAGDEATQQLPSIAEATSPMGALFEPEPVRADSALAAPTDALWSSDPYGRHQLRYWDGRQWTQHVSDAGVGGTDPV